jgi:hypothetical protein
LLTTSWRSDRDHCSEKVGVDAFCVSRSQWDADRRENQFREPQTRAASLDCADRPFVDRLDRHCRELLNALERTRWIPMKRARGTRPIFVRVHYAGRRPNDRDFHEIAEDEVGQLERLEHDLDPKLQTAVAEALERIRSQKALPGIRIYSGGFF